ncbi:hypothetical protein APED_32580 [Acanthopleuribacter pedis]
MVIRMGKAVGEVTWVAAFITKNTLYFSYMTHLGHTIRTE